LKFKSGKKNRREALRALSLMTHLGLTMLICVLIGVVAGRYIDGRLGTSPWLLLVFTVLGAGAAIKFMYDTVMKNMEKDDRQK